jgi:signal transduction histidine kinase/ligand-binding sensor domain-containing protein
MNSMHFEAGWLRALARLAWLAWLGLTWCVAIAHASELAGQKPPVVAPTISNSPGFAGFAGFAFLPPQLESIGDPESIPEGVVTALAQDARGFIWIGTQIGLVRYDGYQFRKFLHRPNDPGSMVGNYVLTLRVARDGRLWVGTNSDGVAVFDPASERFENFSHNEADPASVSAGRIWSLAEDAKGGMWVGTDHGLDYLPPRARHFRHYHHDAANQKSLLYDKVTTLLFDRGGRLWVGSTRGLQRMDENGRDFERVAGDAFLGKNIQTLFQAQDGKLWVGTGEHGAAWLDEAGKVHWLPLQPNRPDALTHGWVSGMAQVQADQIWVATYGGGINIVSASDGRVLQQLRHDPAVAGSLALDVVAPLLLDRSGLLWIGTWAGGLQRFNTKNNMLRVLRHSPTWPTGLSRPDVHSMLELPNGQLLFGTQGNGIDIFDRQRGLVGGYRTGAVGGLPDATIYSLAQTRDGTLWAGTQQAGVVRLLAGSKVWQRIPGLPNQQVKSLLVSRAGGLWVATSAGVVHLNQDQLGLDQPRFNLVPKANGMPLTSRIYSLVEDGVGRIWAGSDSGLWVLAPGSRGWQGIHKEPGRAASFNSELASGLMIDRNAQLWVSSDRGVARLLVWDGKQAQFEHFINQEGGRVIGENLLQDAAGRIWSESAIFNPVTRQMLPLGRTDGLDQGSSWSGSYLKTHDGLLLFGGTRGVVIINPALFQPWSYRPPVVLTALKINNQAQPLGALIQVSDTRHGVANSVPKGLVLQPGQRDFALEFAVLDYSEPKKNRYQYRLQGYDKDWIETDFEHRSAAYGNLWPGKYTLQVRGSNRLGEWSSDELLIPIQVLPAFWQSGWFLGLVLLLTGASVIAGYRWREARQSARALALQNLIDARTADILKLSAIGQELTATLDMELAFERIHKQVSARLDAVVFFIGIVQYGCIEFVYQIEHGRRLPNSVLDLSEPQWAAVWCVREQRELLAYQNQDLVKYIGVNIVPVAGLPMETVFYLPLMAEGRVIGCLSVQSPEPHAYNQDQLEFLRVLASYTAIALSNSAAHNELAQSHEELADALQYLKETQAKLIQAERQQLSLDLHDNLSQTMTGVLLQLDTAREVLVGEGASEPASAQPGLPYVERAIELTRSGMTQTRQLLNQLRSKKNKTEQIDLVAALRRDLPRLTVGTAIEVSVAQHGQPVALAAKLELALFRVAQEAVTNALRHSGAKTIVVTFSYQSDGVLLSVQDDGRGFDLAARTTVRGIGLSGMQERVEALAGTLEIDSAPGQGTRISARMPLLPQYG